MDEIKDVEIEDYAGLSKGCNVITKAGEKQECQSHNKI